MKKADPPLSVQIPSSSADQPSWMRVGVVAIIGFAVGVAWPRLAGIKLGPNAPGTSTANTASESASAAPSGSSLPSAPPSSKLTPGARAVEAPTASAIAPSPTPAVAPAGGSSPEPAAASGVTTVSVKPGIVLGCKSESGERFAGKACGTLTFDALALPRLRKLASCPAAQGNEGKLSPKFHLDFFNNKFTVEMGKKNTVDNIDSFSACLGRLFEKVSINAVTHEHAAYSVQYNIVFAKGEGKAGAATSVAAGPAQAARPEPSESSEAKIAWDVALVRDAPGTGQVVGRIQRGTSVHVLSTNGNWYKVRAGATEGWLYRGAIGR